MNLVAIGVATIDELLSGSHPACTHIGTLSEGGAYLRRLPFRMDNRALDAVFRSDVETYFADNTRGFPAVRHLALRDALVVGQGSVVTNDFRLISESAHEFVGAGLVPDGMIDGGGGLALGSEPIGTIERPTLLLKRPWNANYGHWLVDSAALLALSTGLTLPTGWQLGIRRQDSPAMQEIVRQTLEILAPGVAVLELPDHEIWRFAELHYVSPVHSPLNFMLPAALSALRALVLRDSLADAGTRRGLYVTRGEIGGRALRNEAEVIALCRDFGFDVVRPEQLRLPEQARLFRQANLVVGVKGAALTNALFCTGGTHLVVLSPGDFPDPFYWDLTAPAGIAYSEIFGVLQNRDRPTGQNPFTVSIAGLRTILEACLDDLGGG